MPRAFGAKSVLGVFADAVAEGIITGSVGKGGLGPDAGLPVADEQDYAQDAEQEQTAGDVPARVIEEVVAEGGGENGGAVLVGEPGEDAFVGETSIKLCVQVLDEAGGVGAADMVAFEQYLSAAAGAHQLVTQLVESGRGCSRAEHGERGSDEDDDL